MPDDLLLEIGTEEIPAGFMPATLEALAALLHRECAAARIDTGEISTCGTPRRIVAMVPGVADRQKDMVTQKVGPARNIAFDADGNPTKAALGFARGAGIDPNALGTIENEKGVYVCADIHESGAPTAALLPEVLKKVILALPFPKSMRWHDQDVRFARPIHWIVALLGGQRLEFSIGNVRSGNTTRGHRFMAPGQITVSGIGQYQEAMGQASVMLFPQKRREHILQSLRELAGRVGGHPDEDAALLDEVTWLVESPHPVLCSFDEAFLDLPPEVLLTTMKKHQRYFPVLDGAGKPLAAFVAVNNTASTNPEVVVRGHERVLRARLTDARFFYAEDRRQPLGDLAEKLRTVVFQAQLGTSYEKMERFRELAVVLARDWIAPAAVATVERASYLCKADLVSEMVGEFPELQGIMGRAYARLGGEAPEVAQAIFEHYLPRFAGDVLPQSDAGAIVSIADKLDTITGCFGVGLVPSGTADPYALRRQCIGIITIILKKGYRVSLRAAVQCSLEQLGPRLTREAVDVRADVLGFFRGRLENMLTSQGAAPDVVDAVLSLGIDDIADSVHRIEALGRMKQDPNFEALAVSFKRVVNILAGAPSGAIDPDLFEHDAERVLQRTCQELRDSVAGLVQKKSYEEALRLIATIRPAVDGFFDNVLVMAPQETMRHNRLALLRDVSSLFTDIADFSRIASEQ